jgi:hypothetical protein
MKPSSDARRDRLAAALRENLKRRKVRTGEAAKTRDAAVPEGRRSADKKNRFT